MRIPAKIVIDKGKPVADVAENLAQILAAHPGHWTISGSAPDLLILERVPDGTQPQGRIVLSGLVARGGHLLDIISCVSASRWSGCLTVTSEQTIRDLIFDQGALRMARSNDDSDRLGEMMHRLGKISREQLDEAIGALGPDRRIGEVLVEKGATTAKEVFETIHQQVEEMFYSTIVIDSGVFYFSEGMQLGDLPAYISLDTNNLLMEGVRRIDEMQFFRRLIPGSRIVLQRKPRSFPPGSENELDDEFLARCDGQRTLADVAGDLGIGEYDATRLAHHFLSEGAIEVIPTEATSDESLRFVVDRFNDMIGVVNQAIHMAGDSESFIQDVHSYANSGGEFEDFIAQLELDETGHLDFDNVATVLSSASVTTPMSYLVQVLTQYLFFVLFLAQNHLPRDKHSEISTEVHTMLQKIGA